MGLLYSHGDKDSGPTAMASVCADQPLTHGCLLGLISAVAELRIAHDFLLCLEGATSSCGTFVVKSERTWTDTVSA